MVWSVSDIANPISIRSNDLEFQDSNNEWHHFTIIVTTDRIVYGCVCNVGFIESGYLVREEHESLDESLQELLEDLKTFYNDGPSYITRIIHNDRM
jgi:hypothetical protein